MTNNPNPDFDRRAGVQHTRLDGAVVPAVGRWRSVEAHAWLIVRSWHGLASEVASLGPALSGTVDVYPEAERSVVRLDVDLGRRITGCESCDTTRPDGTTLTLESTRVGPETKYGWALAGVLSSTASTIAVDSELDVRGVHQRIGEATVARFTVRTQVPVAALGLCDSHRLEHAAL